MWMRRHPPTRTGRGTSYEPVYANSGALRAIAAGLSAEAAAAVAAVAPDLVATHVHAGGVAAQTTTVAPIASYPTAVRPGVAGLVRLGFRDLSEVDVPLADPWGRAFLAVAAELCAARSS